MSKGYNLKTPRWYQDNIHLPTLGAVKTGRYKAELLFTEISEMLLNNTNEAVYRFTKQSRPRLLANAH